ncbi:TPA_asm: L [Cypripedium betacytorhabdovirus 1]|nr:TPA_asm: L [Cypripedium betacytorhabdovirus 1]
MDLNIFQEDTFGGIRPKNLRGLGDFHLRSAIKQVSIRGLQEFGRNRELKCLRLISEIVDLNSISEGDPAILLSSILSQGSLLEIEHAQKSDCLERLETTNIVLRRLEAEMHRDLYECNESFGRERLISAIRSHPHCSKFKHLQNLFSNVLVRMIALGSERELPKNVTSDMMSSKYNTEEIFAVTVQNRRFICTSDLFLVEFNNDLSLFKIDIMRMIVDKLTERDLIFIATSIGNELSPDIYPSWDTVHSVIKWGDFVIHSFGNEGYNLLKAFEALVLGTIMSLEKDLVIQQDSFLCQTISDLIKDQPLFEKHLVRIKAILSNIKYIHHLTQIFGLYRIWGHPVINSKKGMEKVFNLGRKSKYISECSSRKMGRLFKEQFYTSYYDKYQRYPNCNMEELEDNYLITMINSRKRININSPLYCVTDWDLIMTQKTFSIPETFNLSLILSDSAISPNMIELTQVAEGEVDLVNPNIRRGILRWLTKDIVDCQQLLKEVNDKKTPNEELVIGLYPKERELNSTPRMFALMTLYIRCYIVITEALLSSDILPLFPQITMTDSMLELTKKIYSSSRKQGTAEKFKREDKYRTSITICLNMDFEKWNLNMRRQSTEFVFHELGLIYGLENLFNATYDIFEQSYIYLSDGDYKLKVKNGKLEVNPPWSYRGHKGGFEGLRQKGWTLFTVVAITSVLNSHQCTYKILGQGDNQVVLLTLYTYDIFPDGSPNLVGINKLKTQLYDIKRDLIESFKLLGLPLKPLETWESEKFFIYGKFPVYKGVPCSMSLKKICRIFPFSNDDIMTIDNVLGAIFSNGQAAAMSDINHLVPYYITLLKSAEGLLWLLKYHPLSGKSPLYKRDKSGCIMINPRWKMKSKQASNTVWHQCPTTINIYQIIEMMLLIPKSLGGFNGLTEYEFLMRGFPDNATRDYTYLHTIKNYYDGFIQVYINNWLKLKLLQDQDYVLLLEDPTALNLYLPQSSLPLLRNEIKLQMREAKAEYNEDFKNMVTIDESEDKLLFVSYLTSSFDLYPRLLHDLYESTLYGYIDSIISKIDKTVTVMRLSISSSSTDIISKLVLGEENFIRYFIWRCFQDDGMEYISCPTNQIRNARNLGWKKNCIGVTVPYPSHTLRWRNCKLREDIELDCLSNDFITVFYSNLVPKSSFELVSTLGQSPPYLGSMTREKIGMKSKLTIQSTEPLLRRPFGLMRLINWVIALESNISDLIQKSIVAITDFDPKEFASIPDASTGSADHRYNDSALKHGGLTASLYSLGSFLHMTTDTLFKYARGSANVTLHFQALLCWSQHISSLLLWNSIMEQKTLPSFSHYHIYCYDCITPVCEKIPDIKYSVPFEFIPSCKSCKYLYVPKQKIITRDNTSNAIINILPIMSGNQFVHTLSERIIRQIISEQLSLMILRDLSDDSKYDAHAQSTGLMEVQNYPRVLFLKVSVKKIFETLAHMCILKEIFRTMESSYEWPTFQVLKSNLLIRLFRVPLGNFLGLSMLFSWKSKRGEWKFLKGAVFPHTYPMTFESMCLAIKTNFILYISKLDVQPVHNYSNYILNESRSDDVIKIIMFNDYYDKLKSKCGYCRYKATLLHFDSEENIRKSLSVVCEKGHYIYREREFLNKIIMINVSLDRASKCVSDHNLKHIRKLKLIKFPKFQDNSIVITSSANRFIYGDDNIMESLQWNTNKLGMVQKYQMSQMYNLYNSPLYSVIDILISEKSTHISSNENIIVIGDYSGAVSEFCATVCTNKIYLLNPSDSSDAFPQSFLESLPCELSEESILSQSVNLTLSQYNNYNLLDKSWETSLRHLMINSRVSLCIITMTTDNLLQSGKFYQDIIIKLARLKIYSIFVKCQILSDQDGYIILNCINQCYNKWRTKVTPFCNLVNKECWVVGVNPRFDILDRYINFQCCIRELCIMKTLVEDPNRYDYSETYLEYVNNLVINSDRFLRMESILSSWFLECNITPFWSNANDFSDLLFDLYRFNQRERRSRGPKIQKITISEKRKQDLAKRLLLIVLSSLTIKSEILQAVESSAGWTIQWIKGTGQKQSSAIRGSPVLIKSQNNIQDYYQEIITFIPIMRNILISKGFPRFCKADEIIYFQKTYQGQNLDYNLFFFRVFY